MYTIGEYRFSDAAGGQLALTLLVEQGRYDLALECQSILERLLRRTHAFRGTSKDVTQDPRQLNLFPG